MRIKERKLLVSTNRNKYEFKRNAVCSNCSHINITISLYIVNVLKFIVYVLRAKSLYML
jgi:hypothetical protein